MNPYRPAGDDKDKSAELTALIILLKDRRGLSFDEIARRLWYDFSLDLTRAAVWQRYRRGKKQ